MNRPAKRWLAAGVAALALTGYTSGTFDGPLSDVGLNRNACVTNAFGAEFCGEDGKRMCREFGGPVCQEAFGLPNEGRLQREIDAEAEAVQQEIDQADREIQEGLDALEDEDLDDYDGDGVPYYEDADDEDFNVGA